MLFSVVPSTDVPHRLSKRQPLSTTVLFRTTLAYVQHTQTHETVPFLCIEKKLHRIKRSNVFNYNISMTIVTIGDKIVERIFESSNGVLFWNHWKNSGPLPTNGCNRIIKLMLVKTRKNVRCLTYKRGKNSSDNV